MLIVPFLFFTGLTLYWWRQHGRLDVCVYMSALYAFCSLLAIVTVSRGLLGEGGVLYNNYDVEINAIPTLLYCVAIAISMLPFSLLHGKSLKKVTLRVPWVVDALSWFLIAESLLNLWLVADSTMDILQGDLAAVRDAHYAGAQSPAQIKAETLNFAMRFFYYFNPSTILALPIFFYNICFRKKSIWMNGALLFASLSAPIAGIQMADRTEMVYYGMMVIFCFLFFRQFFSRKVKRALTIVGVPIVALGVTYVVAVSQSRFDSKAGMSSTDRAIQYGGQSLVNFCYFYDKGNSDYVALEREFPFVHHFLFKKDSTPERRSERMADQGFFISVFPSFAGDIMLDLGVWGMLAWVVCYFLICMMVIQRAHREELDLGEVLLIFMLAIIPVFGIFYYRFYSFMNTFSLILVVGVYLVSRYKLVYK